MMVQSWTNSYNYSTTSRLEVNAGGPKQQVVNAGGLLKVDRTQFNIKNLWNWFILQVELYKLEYYNAAEQDTATADIS
jgi:hypothetical protein